MSDNDRKYIKSVTNRRPSHEVFVRMVEILKNSQKEVDRLIAVAKEIASPTPAQ